MSAPAPALPGSPLSSAGSGSDGGWRERTWTSSSWPRAACGRAQSARARRGGSGPSHATCGSSRTRRPPIAAPSAMRPACSSSPAPARWRSHATAAGAGRAPAGSDRSWATRAPRSGSAANGCARRPAPGLPRGAAPPPLARPRRANRRGRARRPAPRPRRSSPSARAIVTRAQAALADLLVTTARPPSPPPAHRGELERLAARRCRLPGRRLARGPPARPRADPETPARERRPRRSRTRPRPPPGPPPLIGSSY